ncbi:MAG: DUF4160 domain-containing protein [Acidimicrobiaceae bacterium]|nr:DUF4160 domain-containing protein [Acidimicrobiaceae bacterium]
MYPGDHSPPHFHAEYAEHEVQVSIRDRHMLNGSLPPHQSRFVIEWAALCEAELMLAWGRASEAVTRS